MAPTGSIVMPARYATCGKQMRHLTVGPDLLPDDWRAVPWPDSTQETGTFWYEEQASVVLDVPSAVVPYQRNFVINVDHPRFDELEIDGPVPFEIPTRE